MKMLIALAMLLGSITTASAMGKFMDDKTLKQMGEMKLDSEIVMRPVRIVPEGEDDGAAKAERHKSCMAHWAYWKEPKPDEEVDMKMAREFAEVTFSVRVWRCMHRAGYTVSNTKCPAIAWFKDTYSKAKTEPEEEVDEPLADDATDEEVATAEARQQERDAKQKEKAAENRKQMFSAINAMQRSRCYAKFSS